MNVSSNTLHRGSQPLELGDQYWSIRDAIVQAELLIMRMLKFHVTPVHPHKVNFSSEVVKQHKWLLHLSLSFTNILESKGGTKSRNIPNAYFLPQED